MSNVGVPALRPGIWLKTRGRDEAAQVAEHVAGLIEAASYDTTAFGHLDMEQIFPADLYAAMLDAMPTPADYRPMSGRSKHLDAADGTHTRVKIDLFPEYTRHLPPAKREVWETVGRALCSAPVRRAFVDRLRPGLLKRFGPEFRQLRLYPIPILTRDVPGYRIPPHTDTHWKGITVQLYLPAHDGWANVGTVFHRRHADGKLRREKQMRFAPNTGYAFAVGDDTWHSADPVPAGVTSRDSILLTYFVDSTPLHVVRNRARRLSNAVLNEARQLTRSG